MFDKELTQQELDSMFEEAVRLDKEFVKCDDSKCPCCGEIVEQHLHTSKSGDKDWKCPENNVT